MVRPTALGVIFIDKERIEFFQKLYNVLSKLEEVHLEQELRLYWRNKSGRCMVRAPNYSDTIYTNTYVSDGPNSTA